MFLSPWPYTPHPLKGQKLRLAAWTLVTLGVTSKASYGGFPIAGWEFQDPKMEVLYHIRPYFVGLFPYIGLI